MFWVLAAVGSATFAGVTAVLSKCGIKNTKPNVATAIRTLVVWCFAWAIVWLTGEYRQLTGIDWQAWLFLILSGLATGASWICYFKALSLGEVAKVATVDKSSVVLTVLFAIFLFPAERKLWWIKLIGLALIAVGTYTTTDLKKNETVTGKSWFFFAALSAIFAAATSILAKIGIENVPSNLATAIRTCVVLIMAWGIVIGKKEFSSVRETTKTDMLFLVLSGFATGIGWLCYYYAIQQGAVSVVVPIDKMSVLISVAFSIVVCKEKISRKRWAGLALLLAGTLWLAIV